jgi:SAM-dependent methyltransferase
MTAMSRAEREKLAYDEQGVFAASHGWHLRFRHVFECANTREHERLFETTVERAAAGRRVLELGCADGAHAEALLKQGAGSVLGLDVSEKSIERARQRTRPGRLEFEVRDAGEPLEGTYDLIVGRAILHHLDFRPVLKRLHDQNLAAGGTMVFMEPLGGNPLIRLFHWLAPAAHTADERSLTKDDLRWLRATFARCELLPFNYFSLPCGLVSSLFFRRADNRLLRFANLLDRCLARRAAWLWPQFRQVTVIIRR